MNDIGKRCCGIEKRQAERLLAEHAQLKGPADLESWNIKARTFLVFAAMKRICAIEVNK